MPEEQNQQTEDAGRSVAQLYPTRLDAWKTIGKRILKAFMSEQISFAAAGCGFFGTLALFPTISMLISIYGLAFDPLTVEPQLAHLRNFLPPTAYNLLGSIIHTLVQKPRSTLTMNLIISVTVALWSASAGTRALLSALNIAYGTQETRGFLRFHLMALGTTLVGVLGVIVALAVMIALPVMVDILPRLGLYVIYDQTEFLIKIVGPLVMLGLVFIAFAFLYRFGPARPHASWHWVLPGAGIATIVWWSCSVGFSYYVGHIASYNNTYGPLGAVVALMMWLFVTGYVVLLGAKINAELEQWGQSPKAGG